ncbi:PH domain-containing protein [Kineococcus sp. SYSU DK004]|uniref:PH domain-containing protein n=1 Tax=Kineococcus sp. SYSU DK004 TaxID=3383125 RepID=UPI003D7EAE81
MSWWRRAFVRRAGELIPGPGGSDLLRDLPAEQPPDPRDDRGDPPRGTRRPARRGAEPVGADVGDLPRSVRRYVLPSERLVVAVRRHPARLAEPVASAVAGFALWLWLNLELLEGTPFLPDLLLLGWAVLFARAVWQLLSWRVDWFVATDRRLLLTYGVLNRRVAMMPVSKVTDMSYNQSLPGRLLGYGEFVMESAGQDQALHDVDWLPVPDQLYLSIVAEIFGVDAVRDARNKLRRR